MIKRGFKKGNAKAVSGTEEDREKKKLVDTIIVTPANEFSEMHIHDLILTRK